jgi:Uma2 family endonuclease
MITFMGLAAEKGRYTIAEYLEMEEKAVDRHEFHDGEILARSGGTYAHSRISTNLTIMIGVLLDGHPCHPLGSDMRDRIPGQRNYVYPDISVICGEPQFDPEDPKKTTVVNPRVVIEVLSESTESYDRGAKFELYRQIPSLDEYVLVSQLQPQVETYFRQPQGGWLFNARNGLDASVTLQSISITLPLRKIYAGIQFATKPVE